MEETHAKNKKTYVWICQGVMTLRKKKKMFQTKLQEGVVLIVLEHRPSAENVLWESYFTLRAAWEVGGFGLCFIEEGEWALSVYIVTSSDALQALGLEFDTPCSLPYLPFLSHTLTQRQ